MPRAASTTSRRGVVTFSLMAILALTLVLAYAALVAAVIDLQHRRAARRDRLVELREPESLTSLDQTAKRYQPRHLKEEDDQ
jgi:hypothetical protein